MRGCVYWGGGVETHKLYKRERVDENYVIRKKSELIERNNKERQRNEIIIIMIKRKIWKTDFAKRNEIEDQYL